jgi:hypothetical protein
MLYSPWPIVVWWARRATAAARSRRETRGVLFLICHNTIHGQAGQAASSDQNTEQLSTEEIVTDIQAHTIPGAVLIPSVVGELVLLQDKGYRLVVNS